MRNKNISLYTISLVVFLGLVLVNTSFGQDKQGFTYRIKIDYGTERVGRDTTISAERQLTALEVLEYAAQVETHPVGSYIFVTSIDGINGQRGIMAWYYEINNQPSKTLAINNILKSGDTITWIYKKDVCSGSVDKK